MADELEKIQVCDQCFQASCWQAIFMCEESRDAGTIYKTKKELRKLKLEHPSYWKTDEQLASDCAWNPPNKRQHKQ